ncbi:MAG: CoA pyrophosphatase [Rhodospirillales bacterium]|nr:CoA pyrophosphatase [Rhodospirillales bacterium]
MRRPFLSLTLITRLDPVAHVYQSDFMSNNTVPEILFSSDLQQQVTTRVSGFSPIAVDDDGLRRAAVAIVVAKSLRNEEAAVLLTLRPTTINRHSGQFALPGGRLDEGETFEEAALRELREEIGLDLPETAILGRLDDYPTRSGFCITPVVMWGGEAADLQLAENEVEEVFRIPFRELNSPHIPILTPSGHEHPVLSAHIPTVGGSVYAPTAALLYQFREVAIRGLETRVSHFDQPTFAWK